MRALRLALLLLALLAAPAAAQETARESIVVETAQPRIEINLAFKGTELLIFGLVQPDTDAVIVIRGETRPEIVRRKERIAGVWTTGTARTFQTVPAFYAVAASRPIDHLFPDERPALHHELGPNYINFAPLDMVPDDPETAEFREALVDYKLQRGLYSGEVYPVKFLSDQLFRTSIYIPANVPIGRYVVRVHMIKDDRVVAQKETYMIVDKVGLEEQIYRFSRNHAALYGLIAVAIALLAGWLVTFFFRRTP